MSVISGQGSGFMSYIKPQDVRGRCMNLLTAESCTAKSKNRSEKLLEKKMFSNMLLNKDINLLKTRTHLLIQKST